MQNDDKKLVNPKLIDEAIDHIEVAEAKIAARDIKDALEDLRWAKFKLQNA